MAQNLHGKTVNATISQNAAGQYVYNFNNVFDVNVLMSKVSGVVIQDTLGGGDDQYWLMNSTDNIINASEAAAGVTITGTASDSGTGVNGQTATITIVDGSNNVKDTYTTTVSGGTWSVNVTQSQAQGLADGTYTVKADVSDVHGNFIVNQGAATASEVMELIGKIQTEARERRGIELETEVQIVGED